MSSTFGLFNTSIMGMSAQADALANISENIANSSTVGYKRATTHFLTVLNGFQGGDQFGGGVYTRSRYDVGGQGALTHTGNSTDLALRGNGFFVVSDGSGATFLTRAGSFVPDSQGRLVNAAGYYLMGFPEGSQTDALTNMEVVRVRNDRLYANPTTEGTLAANLPSAATTVPAANLPSTNAAGAKFSAKSSLTVYDNLGKPVVLDVYYAKTGPNAWEMTVYDSAAATNGGFPYATAPLATQSLAFDPANGSIASGAALNFTPPGGTAIALDLKDTTQLGAPFGVSKITVNGNAAGAIRAVDIATDGTLSYQLDNGQLAAAYRIGVAQVAAPTALSSYTGNVYAANGDSGQIFVGAAAIGGRGEIASATLEASTVDLATELSTMIVAQRSYTANTQSFQAASEILQVLNNIK
ncbi:flagellar hook protein FlgE [Methylocystis parvus]|uniref:Flagellar hook protein FlgE n=1 Tax=Methylocystis parvus TaxID=134 RepID=A0A6B8M6C2_9HYPH|nr:flagellar hook protein FlgE [Methylocystis parvus]QGM98008.1 flagellar hook protein FlgE [Methylocystis parvus]WBK01676.1 flagellar hook protein FlgE [Methylocystis parvus OBBP]